MAFTFSGGLDLQKPSKAFNGIITAYLTPKQTVIDFSGDKTAGFYPLVSPGETVLAYQQVGERMFGEDKIPVYGGVCGSVTEIIQNSDGQPTGVRITADGERKIADVSGYEGPLSGLSPEKIVEIVKNAAVPCRGSHVFAYKKLLANTGKAKRFILNFCESEPGVSSRKALSAEDLDGVLNGAKLLMKALDIRRCVIGIERESRDLLAEIAEKVKNNTLFEIKKVKQKYPQDEETALIYALNGTLLSDADAPEGSGCAVFDAETAAAVYRAVAFGVPYCERVVTVEGKNVLCPIGTPVAELLEFCGVSREKAVKLISGGPLRGKSFRKADDPVTAQTDAITVIYENDGVPIPEMAVCSRCGRCVSVCPARIIPYRAAELAKQKKYSKSAEYGTAACCECGCCDYVCPAYIPIKKLIRTAKRRLSEIKKNENKEPAAETATETEPEITAEPAETAAEPVDAAEITGETGADGQKEANEPDENGEIPADEPEDPAENGGETEEKTAENEDEDENEEKQTV